MRAHWLLAILVGSMPLAGCVTDGGGVSGSGSGLSGGGLASLGDADQATPKGFVAAPGGLLAGTFGSAMDEVDRQKALAAETTALETGGPGAPAGWRGDDGAYGTVIAGPAYSRPGYARCRDFSHTIFVRGRPQLSRGIACRTPEGNWVSVAAPAA